MTALPPYAKLLDLRLQADGRIVMPFADAVHAHYVKGVIVTEPWL